MDVLPEGAGGLAAAQRRRTAGRSFALLAVCSLGIAVEFSWALLDGNIIPVLRGFGVPFPVASCAFIGGPLAALLLQPALGRATDTYRSASPWGPRRPFIALLGGINLAAIAVLAFLCGAYFRAGAGFLPVALIFLATAAMDCCADLVLTPGRALLGDLAEAEAEAEAQAEARAAAQAAEGAAQGGMEAATSHAMAQAAAKEIKVEATEHANQRWTLGQALGRMGAYFLGALPLQRYFNDLGLLHSGSDAQQAQAEEEGGTDARAHARAFFCTGLAVMSCCYVSALLAGTCGSGDGSDSDGNVEGEQDDGKVEREQGQEHEQTGKANNASDSRGMPNTKATDTSAAVPPSWGSLPRMIRGLCVVQAIGWFAMTCQEMYWTSLLGDARFLGTGLRTSFVGLAAQSVVSLAATAALPAINSRLGTARAFLLAELLFLVLLTLPLLVDYRRHPTALTAAISLSGITFAVHDNNPYVLLEARLDTEEEKKKGNADAVSGAVSTSHRGYMLALLNNTLPAAVTVAGLFSGSAIALLGGGSAVSGGVGGPGLARFLSLVGVGGFCVDCCVAGPAWMAWCPAQTWDGEEQEGEDGGPKDNGYDEARQTPAIGEHAPLVEASDVGGAACYSS